jgi:transcriptional regulator with XRE-family HTH domain
VKRGGRDADEVDRAVARRIRRRRVALGMTQQQIAELLEVTYQQAHKYEAGRSRIPAGRLHEIARALGVEVEYFFEEIDPEDLSGGAGPDEAGRGQQRRVLELVRHAASIRDPKHREALCRLARDLAALEAGVPPNPPVEQGRPPSAPQSGLDR